jgi:hypothetical protein
VTRKHLCASIAVALAVVTSTIGLSNPAAHAATSCGSVVLQQTPVTGNNATHGYLYLMHDLCDNQVFLRLSTDLWESHVDGVLNTIPRATIEMDFPWGGHADSVEVPYTSGASYPYQGWVYGFWGDTYYGSGMYIAP